ncbi:unnamed protein product, partial [Leptidea sinapis]
CGPWCACGSLTSRGWTRPASTRTASSR